MHQHSPVEREACMAVARMRHKERREKETAEERERRSLQTEFCSQLRRESQKIDRHRSYTVVALSTDTKNNSHRKRWINNSPAALRSRGPVYGPMSYSYRAPGEEELEEEGKEDDEMPKMSWFKTVFVCWSVFTRKKG